MTRLLTIMGSGETSPTMVKPHREVFEQLGIVACRWSPVPSIFSDTPFGFQENADELSAKTVEYFKVSPTVPSMLPPRDVAAATTFEREVAFNAIRQALIRLRLALVVLISMHYAGFDTAV